MIRRRRNNPRNVYDEFCHEPRHSESAEAFFRKLGRHGASNESMRTFVATLRTHVAAFGADASDERIWTILRRLQILVFDFSAEHGQSEALVRERCVHAIDLNGPPLAAGRRCATR
jgi:hypothetical protein